jgi:hypothetical protein
MVAYAVCDEPVSYLFSLITGKKQGNFGKMGHLAVTRDSKHLGNSVGWLKIPCAW